MAILARRQYGVVAHDQLLELGFTPPAIRYRLRCARLRMVHPRVYAVGAQPLVAHGHWYAALLACRPDPVLSHLSSAAKRGLAKERSGVHVTTTNRSARRLKGVTIHRCRRLDPADVERIDGLPVTTLPRMFLDLAETAPFDVVRGILEEAERRELLDLNAIDACIARNPGRRGIAPLSRLLAIYMPIGTANEGLEVDFTRFVAELGLPSPLCNTLVDGLLVDFYWPQARLVVELDSRGFHAHWAAAERDRMRDAQLMRLGIHTLRVTGRRLNHDRAALFGDIAARFAATGHPLDR
ncbi:MAG TPA: DUF559 domain-containing protein [Solirubrobacterales bacterium]|nr:DUF559 domain-containing protein [Solirubrobacterales bacterium]